VHIPTGPVLWLLGRLTGYRLRHLLALTVVLAGAVIGVAIAFWWLGERADSAAGLVGVLIVASAYVWAVTVVLALTFFAVARLTVARVRRRTAPLGFGGAREPAPYQ